MLTVIKRKMFNGGGVEYYLALAEFPEAPISTPRCKTSEELIDALENMLDAARTGETVEVKE